LTPPGRSTPTKANVDPEGTPAMPKISPWLWFEDQAEEAANFYVSVFPNSRILDVSHYPDNGPGEPGRVMVVTFELDGQQFNALNGGPQFQFSEAISFEIQCQDQAEVDGYWSRLVAGGGSESECGWCKDKYGVSWQVIPKRLGELLGDPDPARSRRALQAMLKMGKIDVAALERAADGA
jgi:predicted 3-demethylubiquinone-9 3-methyltransferase (glyoxalase superfamily)